METMGTTTSVINFQFRDTWVAKNLSDSTILPACEVAETLSSWIAFKVESILDIYTIAAFCTGLKKRTNNFKSLEVNNFKWTELTNVTNIILI